jgi:hypothetical protein
VTAPTPAAYRPPAWTAIWAPADDGNGRKVWRFTLADGAAAELWHLDTDVCAEDDHPPASVWASRVQVIPFPGTQWEYDGHRWTRPVYPVTAKAEAEIIAEGEEQRKP